jgi:hypothetical protein
VKDQDNRIAPEQRAYAALLDAGMKLSTVVLLATFLVYILGLRAPHIPLRELPHCWTMSAKDFIRHARVEAGWGWLDKLHTSDYLNFIGVVLLSGLSAMCYVRIIPILWRKRDFLYVGIAVLEVLIIALAASGVIRVGH